MQGISRLYSAFAYVFIGVAIMLSAGEAVAQAPSQEPAQGSATVSVQPAEGPDNQTAQAVPKPLVRIVPFGRGQSSSSVIKPLAPVGANLTYFGGPVVSNIQVVVVFWGASVNAQATAPGALDQFYTDITTSHYFDLITEYSTSGLSAPTSNQSIGHGTFGNKFTIAPSKCATSPVPPAPNCALTDSDIQTELAAQLAGGHLPAPVTDAQGNANTWYAIYFPPRVDIAAPDGTPSCKAGGFCAYHSNTAATLRLPYGVFPDFSVGGCSTGCGLGTLLQNITAVSSHEMVETITDAQVGSATTTAAPLAWYDPGLDANNQVFGEIGDICNGQDVLVSAGNASYMVQQQYSNVQGDCVDAPPAVVVNAPPSTSVGASPNVTVTLKSSVNQAALAGYTGTVHFTSTDAAAVLPADYTFTATDAGSHSFSMSLNSIGNQTITAADVRSSGFAGSTTINVVAAPFVDLSINESGPNSVSQGATSAIYGITITNVGSLISSGTVTVADSASPGLTATAISGTGWSCTLANLTCTRADGLAANASYPTITITFNVANNAPANVSSTAVVSGGGDGNNSNNQFVFTTPVSSPISFANNGSPTVTVPAGQPAVVNLAVTVQPAAGTVSFSCTGLPTGAACSFNPPTITSTLTVQVTISTTARSSAAPLSFRGPGSGPWMVALFGLLSTLVLTSLLRATPRRRLAAGFAFAMLLGMLAGCGGGGGGSGAPIITNPNGTPAGTFAVTVNATGTAGAASQPITLTVR